MKANIVLMIEAVRAIAESGNAPKRPVNILLTCDEEVGSPTGRAVVEADQFQGDVATGEDGTGAAADRRSLVSRWYEHRDLGRPPLPSLRRRGCRLEKPQIREREHRRQRRQHEAHGHERSQHGARHSSRSPPWEASKVSPRHQAAMRRTPS
ncbi:MAG: M20/M25/M40 family metallo-hydrolase [Planctomycetia bacterium]